MLLNISPDTTYRELLETGVKYRNSNDMAIAEIYLLAARLTQPDHWQPDFELSKLYALINRFEIGLEYAISSFDKSGGAKVQILNACFEIAMKLQDFRSIPRVCAIADASREDIALRLNILFQANKYKEAHGSSSREQMYKKVSNSSLGYLNKSQVVNLIKDAYEKSSPFCFIRLGDGEGTWLFKDSCFEMEYNTLSQANKREFLDIWFNGLESDDRSLFETITSRISYDLLEADLIGVPPLSWIDHEFSIASVRGMPGTLNVIKHFSMQSRLDLNLCTQLMHFELSESKLFYDFISSLPSIVVISCHPGIKKYFQDLGVTEVDFIGVPGEPSRAHLHGDGAVKGSHFPDGYNNIMSSIRDLHWHGRVCLVGAGILGKAYALEIKRQGGIAIDVGSLMDKWMGKKTRPNF